MGNAAGNGPGLPATGQLFSGADLRRLIIPLVIEQTLALSIGMFDTIMVAYAGESAVSGVSLVDSINYLIVTMFSALATGGAIVAGQYLGSGNGKGAGHAAKQLLVSVSFIALAITTLCLGLNGPILRGLFGNVEAGVMTNARVYFYITAGSFPFIAIFNVAAALFRGMGNSRAAMVNAFVMNALNIAGNAVFIYACKWGAMGAALSTLLSRAVACIPMLGMLRSISLPIHIRSYSLRGLDLGMIRRILRVGVPGGLENALFQMGRLVMTGLVASFGTASIAAHAVGTSLAGIQIVPGQAVGLAITTVVARCVGAGQYGQARAYTGRLMKLAYGMMAALNLVIALLVPWILGLYNLSAETYGMAWQIVMLHGAAATLVWPVSFSLPAALRAAGDVRFPMLLSVFSVFVFRVGSAFLFAYVFHFGVLSVWLAMVVDWLFRSAVFLLRWKNGKWQRFTVI